MAQKTITLSMHLELGDVTGIDRTGRKDDYITLLGIKIPKITIPVRPGRNVAIIMEVAAMNYRLKTMGAPPASMLDEKLLNLLG